jgi:hypothetical protein
MSFGLLVKVQYLSNVVGNLIKYISGARLVTEAGDGLLAESGDQIITE